MITATISSNGLGKVSGKVNCKSASTISKDADVRCTDNNIGIIPTNCKITKAEKAKDGLVFTVTADVGHQFSDGTTTKTIKCTSRSGNTDITSKK